MGFRVLKADSHMPVGSHGHILIPCLPSNIYYFPREVTKPHGTHRKALGPLTYAAKVK